MESNEFTVALFAYSPEGVRLLARSADRRLVDSVRELLAAEGRRELNRVSGSPVRAVPPDELIADECTSADE